MKTENYSDDNNDDDDDDDDDSVGLVIVPCDISQFVDC